VQIVTTTERKNKTKEFKDVVSNLSDASAQKILEANAWNVQSALNDYFNNPSKYESEKKAAGSADKIRKIFDKYADKEDKDIMSEAGMVQFFKDISVNPDGHETLVISWLLSCGEMGLIQRKEFVDGFSSQGCSSIPEIKGVIKGRVNSLSNEVQFKQFYKWVFEHVKEDEKKKNNSNNFGDSVMENSIRKQTKRLTIIRKVADLV